MDPNIDRGHDSSFGRSALFAVTPKGLSMGDLRIPLASAPAFGSAIESKDTVVAVGTPRSCRRLSPRILGDASSKKVYLFRSWCVKT